jgi:hypothetical protein
MRRTGQPGASLIAAATLNGYPLQAHQMRLRVDWPTSRARSTESDTHRDPIGKAKFDLLLATRSGWRVEVNLKFRLWKMDAFSF